MLAKAGKSIGKGKGDDKEPMGPPPPTPACVMVGVLNNDEGDRDGGGSEVPMGTSGPKSNHSLNSKCCSPLRRHSALA